MAPLLLLLLAAGAVAAVASSNKSKADPLVIKRVYLGPPQPGYEKFEDPFYACYGNYDAPERAQYSVNKPPRPLGLNLALNRPYMDNAQADLLVGYEYLSTVNRDAKSRIGAIRFKVETYKKGNAGIMSWFWLPGPGRTNPGSTFTAIRDVSRSKLNNYAVAVYSAYENLTKTASAADKFASAYGVSSESVRKEIASIATDLGKQTTSEVLDRAVREYGPVAKAISNGVNQLLDSSILTGGTGPGKTDSNIAAALDIIGSAASAFPGYGTIVSLAASTVSGMFSKMAADKTADCQASIEKIRTIAQATIKNGDVVPWHFDQIFPPDVCFDYGSGISGVDNMSDQQTSALRMLRFNQYFQQGNDAADPRFSVAVNPRYLNATRKWWALAQLWMSHAKVSEVFAALGRDASGGVIASDEQVMLVAAPYAAANGFDVDAFAEALWTMSAGWRGAEPRFMVRVDAAAKWTCYGRVVPSNAWWLQWAILAEDAEKLVETWRARPELATKSSSDLFVLKSTGALRTF